MCGHGWSSGSEGWTAVSCGLVSETRPPHQIVQLVQGSLSVWSMKANIKTLIQLIVGFSDGKVQVEPPELCWR